MKRILIILLTIFMLLNGCAQTAPEPSTTPPTAEPTQMTEPTDLPTEPTETTERLVLPGGYDSEATRPAPDIDYHDVYVFPYTQEDLDSAVDTIMGWIEDYKTNEEVLYYEVDEILFNPVGLHQRISVYESMGPAEGQTPEENYQCRLLVEVIRTVHYDGTLSPNTCYSHRPAQFILYRENPESPWQYDTHCDIPLAPGYRQMLTSDELANLDFTDERVLAGYFEEGGFDIYNHQLYPYEQDTYFLYVVDEETNTVVCREYPAE